ncbi:hypothetical protein FH972_018533 [Carpinus fangiana]|uniref:EF-hand domain-containing protein n=1 Tax=Carpinus fangiana TaxID=176857 RepID=A0A5N6RMS2_9ROSI|nr:hypothetical protein FH972_018533 [Carpinus fangiana]
MPLYVPKVVHMGITEEQLKSIFKQQDANGDGRLSKDELKKAFQQLGSHIPGWRALRAVHHADVDGDGSIGTEELEEVVAYALTLGYSI